MESYRLERKPILPVRNKRFENESLKKVTPELSPENKG